MPPTLPESDIRKPPGRLRPLAPVVWQPTREPRNYLDLILPDDATPEGAVRGVATRFSGVTRRGRGYNRARPRPGERQGGAGRHGQTRADQETHTRVARPDDQSHERCADGRGAQERHG